MVLYYAPYLKKMSENIKKDYTYIESIESVQPVINKVLIKIFKPTEERTKGGIYKTADTDILGNDLSRTAKHTDRHGIVIAIPKQLVYSTQKRMRHHSMKWKVDMELKVGDLVWYDYIPAFNCPRFLDKDMVEYILIDYEHCFVAQRKDIYKEHYSINRNDGYVYSVIMLNGYLLCRYITEEDYTKSGLYISMGIDVNDTIGENKQFGIVKYLGSKVLEYSEWEYINPQPDTDEIKVDDKVIFRTKYDVDLEYGAHLNFDYINRYRLIQRKDIIGIITD